MSERNRPSFVPVLITLAASFVLSVGSFYGCDRTLTPGGVSQLNKFFFWSFAVCAACFAGALGWLAVSVVLNEAIREKSEDE